MKYILQGIKDYCKDCMHDWHLHYVERHNGNQPLFYFGDHTECGEVWVALIDWKEGNLWHYIRQRKVGNRVKKDKKKEFDRRKKEIADICNNK